MSNRAVYAKDTRDGQGSSVAVGGDHQDFCFRMVSICMKSWCLPLFMPGQFSAVWAQALADAMVLVQKGQVRHCSGLTG